MANAVQAEVSSVDILLSPSVSSHSWQAKPRELRIDFHGMTFAAQEWGDPTGRPVLALHGWLDNSASFNRLAPQLNNTHLIALDMAGHGLTDHRPGVEPYNIWEDVGEIFGIADQLGWQQFALLGHSRGAIMSVLAAGTFPERITHVGLLDGLWSQPGEAGDAPQQLARSILENQRSRSTTVYTDVEEMVDARMRGRLKLSRQAAEAIIGRGVRPVAGGYSWSSDPHLMTASAFKLTREHIQAFMGRVQAPVRLLLAEDGMQSTFQEPLPDLPELDISYLPGSHHFHMEAVATDIAARLDRFWAL